MMSTKFHSKAGAPLPLELTTPFLTHVKTNGVKPRIRRRIPRQVSSLHREYKTVKLGLSYSYKSTREYPTTNLLVIHSLGEAMTSISQYYQLFSQIHNHVKLSQYYSANLIRPSQLLILMQYHNISMYYGIITIYIITVLISNLISQLLTLMYQQSRDQSRDSSKSNCKPMLYCYCKH